MSKDNDFFEDDYWRYVNASSDYGNSGTMDGCVGVIFKIVLSVIAVVIVWALLLGVGIPVAVWGFFVKVILVVGFFAFLGSLGSRK